MGEVCNKYYLYHEGHPLEGLCLGFLCFGRLAYSEPLQEEDWHYSPAPLSDSELQEWADIQHLEGDLWLKRTNQQSVSVGLNLAELLVFGPAANRSEEILVQAKKGRKLELKEPRRFLIDKILASEAAKTTLQRWLTISRPNFKSIMTSPKVWYLTGLYELEETTSVVVCAKGASIRAEASPALTAVVAQGVPIPGLGTEASSTVSLGQKLTTKERRVWAAKYQRVDVNYVRARKDTELQPLSLELKLLPVWSRNIERGANGPSGEADASLAQLSLEEPRLDFLAEDVGEGEEYWEVLRRDSAKYKRWLAR